MEPPSTSRPALVMTYPIDTAHPSPNHSARDGAAIELIVLHATVGSFVSALAWLTTPASRVSSHYLIDRRGHIARLVDETEAAWHAGLSSWRGLTSQQIQDRSIGIELENANTGRDPYSAAQLAALTWLVSDILARYHLPPDAIVTHAQVALPPGRKTDPAGFDLAAFRAGLVIHSYRVARFGTVPRQSRDPGALPAAYIPPGTQLVIDDVTNGWAHVGAGDATWGQIGFCPLGDLEAV